MAETLISPGVLARENDQSFIGSRPVTSGAAIVGPAVMGPVGIPTAVSSFSQYQAIFGGTVESGSQYYTYLNSTAAQNYFQQGGESLLVTRVVTGSFSAASSSIENGAVASGNLNTTFNVSSSITTNSTDATNNAALTVSAGSITGGSGANTAAAVLVIAGQVVTSIKFTAGTGYAINDVLEIASGVIGGTGNLAITLKAQDIVNGSAFVLSTLSEGAIMNNYAASGDLANGALSSGTADNLRWEVPSANTSSGQFALFIRRGNDVNTQKAILESYNNLSMDPTAPNYVARAIGDTYYTVEQDGVDYYVKTNGNYPNRSAYVRVSSVLTPTPQYFDNNGAAKPAFFSSLPIASSGSFQGANGLNIENNDAKFNENISATNIQGVSPNDYTQSLNLLTNTDDYQFNVISAPGLIHSQHASQVNQLVSLAQGRTDCISVIDLVPYNSTINTVTTQAGAFDSSYSATYWPWLQSIDPNTAQTVWSPASVFIPGVYAFTDASSDPWFAPAGLIRGALGNVVRAERKLTSGNRDTLYEANVNPIASFPGSGTVVFGQKTLQKRASALDRVNVRRLLISLKDYIVQVSDNLVFEQNTISTRNSFLSQVNPYLESVQQRQGLYSFKVVMDATNNTPDVIDRNELVGQIFLQPTKTAEFIILDFNVLPTGATFPS